MYSSSFETNLAVSQKLKHALTIRASNPTPRYTSKRNENICPHKNLYTNVQISFIHNKSQKVEATQICQLMSG